MEVTAVPWLPVVGEVVGLGSRSSKRPVLVRSMAGGGANRVAITAADELRARGGEVMLVPSLSELQPDAQLELRTARRTRLVLLAIDHEPPAELTGLLDYLRPQVVDVEPVGLDVVRRVFDDHVAPRRCPDELAMSVLVATGGRLGDVLDVAAHLASAGLFDRLAGGSIDLGVALRDFAPSADRLRSFRKSWTTDADRAVLDRWAIATTERLVSLAGDVPDTRLRSIDAIVTSGVMGRSERRQALRSLCDAAASVAGELTPEDQVVVASWWCELALADAADGTERTVTGPELHALVSGVFVAADVGRWDAVGTIAERLWRTTKVPQAAVGVAAALARSAPTPLLDELLAAHPDDELLMTTAAFSRALWQLYVEHRPDRARSTLERVLASAVTHRELCEDGLATVDLHVGDPDAVERRVGDRDPRPGQPTSFALHALALADLQRGRHRRVMERLDDELERALRPGMNLTPDRYRFVRSLVQSRSGSGAPDERAELPLELARLHEGALRRRDDWNLGWTGWVAGQYDGRRGRVTSARRRLITSVGAFRRAHRPGFADWPLATLVATAALHVGEPVDERDVAALADPTHAVRAERADALLALALHERNAGASVGAVAARLREAHEFAVRQREVSTGHLVSVEQMLLGVTPSVPPDDPEADGPVLEACRRAREGSADALEQAGATLVELDWTVLGVRLLARAAERVRVEHPLRATRLLQTVRAVADSFDEPLQAWALSVPTLPTLSPREMEVAEGIARGATRDELAATLHLSRRTIDSHLQRVYAKLGISGRSELRSWMDDPARGTGVGRG